MPFSPDYFTARDRFRAAAARLGWAHQAFPIDACGPAGEELTFNVAVSPGPAGLPVLVLASGVHGVEGFFGSAVQLALMEDWSRTGPPVGVRCVLLHGICPFGFAHIRRFDETNTDLNRNFLPPGEPYAGAPPAYAALDHALNPRRPPSRWEFFTLRAGLNILRYGYASLRQAIVGGQYEFPRGIFFGGQGPARVHQIIAEQFTGWIGAAPTGVLLDFHTGLGPWGTCKLLIDPPFTPWQYQTAARWFGPELLEETKPDGTAYRSRGGFDIWCAAKGGPEFIALCAEFGTYGNLRVLAGVRAENMTHHWGDGPDDPRARRAKAELRELFCPADPGWRAAVIAQSRRLVAQAVAGLCGE